MTPVEVALSPEWQDWTRIVAADASIGDTPVRLVSVHPSEKSFDADLLAQRPDVDLAARLPGARYVWSCDVAYTIARDLVAGSDVFVIGGDWNTARQFDETMRGLDPGTGSAFFARAEADGWHESYFRRHGREGRTWFRTGNHGYQLDHVFTDPATGATVRDCWIDERAAALAPTLSDHAPVIVELEG